VGDQAGLGSKKLTLGLKMNKFVNYLLVVSITCIAVLGVSSVYSQSEESMMSKVTFAVHGMMKSKSGAT
jgi:hypothetical protein